MKVTLNIENDAELRAYVKDIIKGQVLSLTRGELFAMVKEELERKVKSMEGKYNFDYLYKEALKQAAADKLWSEAREVVNYGKDYAEAEIKEKVDAMMRGKDWKKMVDDAAQQLLRSLIK